MTTPELLPGITPGMLPSSTQTLSPLNSNGENIASFGAFLAAFVSVLAAPNPIFFQR